MSNSIPPLISVIIPAFNREKYIAQAIDSVLGQDYSPIELIVVDDGSTDDTAEIVQSYGDQLIYMCQENQGVSAARNCGIGYAHGEYLAFLDSDDIWTEGKLTKQLTLLNQNPELDVIYGHAEQFFSPEVDEEFRRKTKIPKKIMPSQIAPAMLIRIQSFNRVGLFDPQYRAGADIDWYARSNETGLKNFMMPDVVYRRRVHPSNATACLDDANVHRLRTLKAALDRRRAAGMLAK